MLMSFSQYGIKNLIKMFLRVYITEILNSIPELCTC